MKLQQKSTVVYQSNLKSNLAKIARVNTAEFSYFVNQNLT